MPERIIVMLVFLSEFLLHLEYCINNILLLFIDFGEKSKYEYCYDCTKT